MKHPPMRTLAMHQPYKTVTVHLLQRYEPVVRNLEVGPPRDQSDQRAERPSQHGTLDLTSARHACRRTEEPHEKQEQGQPCVLALWIQRASPAASGHNP